jgi:hypothetical protein
MTDVTDKATAPPPEQRIAKIREELSLLSRDIKGKFDGDRSEVRITLDALMDRYIGLDVFLLEHAEIEIAKSKRGNSRHITDTRPRKSKSPDGSSDSSAAGRP